MEYWLRYTTAALERVHAGYWLCDVTGAEENGSEIVPLYQKLYSARLRNSSARMRKC